MPELPDLQVFSENLAKKIGGKKLLKLELSKSAKLSPGGAAIKKAVEGQKLKSIDRVGKEIWFRFQNKAVVAFHMMLHGKLYWLEDKPDKFGLAIFDFGKGLRLGLADFQRAARITLNPEESDVPDALSPQLNARKWAELLQSRAGIKNLLLDQHIVRGIGNAYADEILWASRISPLSIAEKIPSPAIRKLAASVKKILKDAQKKIAKKEPGIIGGEVRDFLVIHNAKKDKSPTGATIRKIAAGRKTYYTDEQILYK